MALPKNNDNSNNKKVPVKEIEDKNSVLKSLQETPVNDTIQTRKKSVIIRTHLRAGLLRILSFAGICVLIFTFIFGGIVIESNDMYPAVRAGDALLYYRLAQYKNMDVVVYKTPDGLNIGRIQGIENDIINITDKGQITINGNIQPIVKRQGVFYKTYERKNGAEYPITLNKDEFFILGDERDSAQDSRLYGQISKSQIKGKVFMLLRRRAV